jgi:ABC-type transporter Mla subunit MlaD
VRLITITILILVFFSCRYDYNKLTILFDNVEGLEKGADVYYRGIKIGEVTHLDLFQDKVVADIKLKDSIRIPVSSRFIINPSVIGSAHITIEPSAQTSFFSSKDTVVGEYSKKQLLDDFVSDTIKRRKVQESFEKIGEGIKGLVEASSKNKDTLQLKINH